MKTEEDVFKENRYINRKTLEAILERYCDVICKFIKENQSYFHVAPDETCLKHLCVLLAYYPQVYDQLEATTKYQIENFDADSFNILKWFVVGDLEQHLASYRSIKSLIPLKVLETLKKICEKQGLPRLFPKMLIKHYSRSGSFASSRDRFDEVLSHYLPIFTAADFIELIDVINGNRQIYGYIGQRGRNDKILEYALPLLPEGFNLESYPNFKFTKPEVEADTEVNQIDEPPNIEEYVEIDEETGDLPW